MDMAEVTIEGSLSPCAYLARGERRTVQRDKRVDALIEGGYVVVVELNDVNPEVVAALQDPEWGEPEPTPEPVPDDDGINDAGAEPEPPKPKSRRKPPPADDED